MEPEAVTMPRQEKTTSVSSDLIGGALFPLHRDWLTWSHKWTGPAGR